MGSLATPQTSTRRRYLRLSPSVSATSDPSYPMISILYPIIFISPFYLGTFRLEASSHLFYYRILTSLLTNFSGKFDLLMLCGEIESNPGPRSNSSQSFSICHLNLNSIAAHNFSKISLLRVYSAIYNYDMSLRNLS